MSNETIFIVLGLTLTALALIVSFVGVKAKGFPPSRGAMIAGTGVFAVLVGATAVFAWTGAEDEQHHRDELIAAGELPSPADIMAEYETAYLEEVEAGEGGGAEGETETASVDGAALFDSEGCAGCHALEAAGAVGAVGPDLDTALAGVDEAYIEESIANPDAEIAKGFTPGIMPSFDELEPEQLEALVAFLAESTGNRN